MEKTDKTIKDDTTTPTVNSLNTVDTNQLDGKTDFNIANPTVTPTKDFSLTVDTTGKELATQKDEAKSEFDKLQEAFGLKSEKEQQYRDEYGANASFDEYNKYKKEIALEKNRLDREIRNLSGKGLTEEQVRTTSNALTRQSEQSQADKAILGNAALGDYEAAKTKAKEKVDLEFAPIEVKLNQAKQTFEDSKELFTDFEKKKITSQFNAQEKEIEAQRKEKQDSMDMITNAISQGASSGISQKALDLYNKGATRIEIAQALGKYAGDYLGNQIKLASLAKTNAEINKIASEIKSSNAVIDTSGLPNTTTGIATKLMASAKNDKQLDATERQSLSKARTVINQLDNLEKNISNQNHTGLIKGNVGKLTEKIGANADVGVINAQLQAITPNLARGVYGEVGVLTDNDIKLYRTTLPRLDRKEDQNDAIMAMTLKTVAKSIENTLTGAANSGIDVSGWTQDYLTINKQIADIEDRIGVSKAGVDELIKNQPNLAPAIKEMYQQGLTDGEILEATNAR